MDIKTDFSRIKTIYFIGIGGIGLSAIAKLMKENGKNVRGSDLTSSIMTEKLKKIGVDVNIGQSENSITSDLDLVVYTIAAAKNNPELKKAKDMNITTMSYPEALGAVFNEKNGIAICGTHGKSTVTAMAGLLLDDAGSDPTVLVGSIVPRYESNLRIGKSDLMIIEACEYERAFLNYYPRIMIINNIELDHTDYYKDVEDFRGAFEEFVSHLSKNGILIINGDDKEISKLRSKVSRHDHGRSLKIINFGLGEKNDVQGCDIETVSGATRFKVKVKGKYLGEFALKVPGEFNVRNALAVIALGLELNVPITTIKSSLIGYSGIWRRFEIKGELRGATVISDYAHHPTAVRVTIEAAHSFFPKRRIFVVFQPHQHNRTKMLYKDFLTAFNDADVLILSEIFDVAGREEKEDRNVSSLNLANDIKDRNKNLENKVFYAKDLSETRKLIDEKIQSDDVVLIMGAGDIYKIADDLTR